MDALLTTALDTWAVDHVIAYDWYDGPRSGVCRLRVPQVEFVFELVDERFRPDDLDDRWFAVRAIAPGTVAGLERGADATDGWLAQVLAQAAPASVVIMTADFKHFTGVWPVERYSTMSGPSDGSSGAGAP